MADVLKSHRLHIGKDLEQTLLLYASLHNHQFPQSALKSRTSLQAMKDWHVQRPDLFIKRPHRMQYLTNGQIGVRHKLSLLVRTILITRKVTPQGVHRLSLCRPTDVSLTVSISLIDYASLPDIKLQLKNFRTPKTNGIARRFDDYRADVLKIQRFNSEEEIRYVHFLRLFGSVQPLVPR